MKPPTYEEMAKRVAEQALDSFEYQGKTIREWIKIIAEQEPYEDAISRQAVLDCFTWTNDKADIWNRIKDLPSVTPQYTDAEIQKMQELEQDEIEKAYELGKASQPKIGHWIDDCGGVKCSCCGYSIDDYFYAKTYCPNCGCRMESEDNESDKSADTFEKLLNSGFYERFRKE